MATIFSRWVPYSLPLFGVDVKLKLRAFNKLEAPAFKAAVNARFANMGKQEGESDAAHEERAQRLLEDWLVLAKNSFAKWVRLEEPLKDEESEQEITTGEQLYDEAPGDFVMKVMLKLAEYASLGDTEGKGSSSPSTSTVEAGPATTERAASITEELVSPSFSTAPVTTTGAVPFSRRA